ncbi:MAG: LytTR family transcriptional regulator DNA-binding domain-containing protein [Clostridia bacterium]|nr:LytTR family transcriptional regulator DNA-binding domain-containing protein [Clostridia bacterium]
MELLNQLAGPEAEAVVVFDGYGNVQTLNASEIVSASMEGKLVHVVTETGSWYTRRTLQSMETVLEGGRFVRISRYELVNLDKVQRYDFTIAGKLRLELVGGMETWASRRCIPDIRKRLKGGV